MSNPISNPLILSYKKFCIKTEENEIYDTTNSRKTLLIKIAFDFVNRTLDYRYK